MVKALLKIFLKDTELSTARGRSVCGNICGWLGIAFNALLFALKLAAGMLSGSVAITADAFNNLSDAGSSAVTLIGFRISEKKPDKEHPFGHGRSEYISGLIVAMLIILMGVELIQSSFEKLSSPESAELSVISVAIMLFGILVKLYMFAYNKKYGKIIDSAAMRATASDSLSDALSGGVVLAAGAITHFTGNPYIDIVCGIIVSLLIIKAGISAAKDTLSPLLGKPASAELVTRIGDIVLSHTEILGIHDMIIHDYGPGRFMVSLHAEVPANNDILKIHDLIDNIENELCDQLGCDAVIHMDPINTDDEKTIELNNKIREIAASLDPELKIHDLRVVYGETHTNIIFDLVIPQDNQIKPADAVRFINAEVKKLSPEYNCVIKVDRPYTES